MRVYLFSNPCTWTAHHGRARSHLGTSLNIPCPQPAHILYVCLAALRDVAKNLLYVRLHLNTLLAKSKLPDQLQCLQWLMAPSKGMQVWWLGAQSIGAGKPLVFLSGGSEPPTNISQAHLHPQDVGPLSGSYVALASQAAAEPPLRCQPGKQ